MEDRELYAKPHRGVAFEECSFYHRMHLPDDGEVGDQWDLRDVVDQYLGEVDFRGKRVLDVGAGSGYLTFEMEKRGAEVVSVDMAEGDQWNLVPHAGMAESMQTRREKSCRTYDRFRNSYWYAHEKLSSTARAYHGDIYNLPVELGRFDTVFFGMVLGHLRDPFQAVYSAARLCKETIIVTNPSLPNGPDHQSAYAILMPTRENCTHRCWWALSENCIQNILEILGFDVAKRVNCRPTCLVDHRSGEVSCTATVATRVLGGVEGVDLAKGGDAFSEAA